MGGASQRISQEGSQGALDKSSPGLIGYVTKYYGNDPALEKEERHTVDIDVPSAGKSEKYYRVPCFVYSQGIIDKGLEENDRVWVQFINGDQKQPIVTGFYREPGSLELFFNNLEYRISDFLGGIFR